MFWVSSTPRESRPCGASICPRSIRMRSTTAVLLGATIAPSVTAAATVGLKNHAAAAISSVRTTRAAPPSSGFGPSFRSRATENSRPRLNSGRATPNSATASISCSEVATGPDAARPAEGHPGQELADDTALPEPGERPADQQRPRQQHDDVTQDEPQVHGRLSGGGTEGRAGRTTGRGPGFDEPPGCGGRSRRQ